MAQKKIRTSIDILASPSRIWEILINFSDYGKWNPFLTLVEGDVRVGKTIKVNAGGMVFNPKIIAFEEGKEIRWIGKLLFKGVFDGEHSFQIIDNKNGTSTFKHEEKFEGILVGLFSKKLDTETTAGFKAMNEKLKELAENAGI